MAFRTAQHPLRWKEQPWVILLNGHAGADESGSMLSTGASVTNLSGGIYTVKAIRNSTGAVIGTMSAVVLNQQVIPVVSIQVLSHLTSCAKENGSLRAIVSELATDYTYQWYSGTVFTGNVISTSQSFSKFPAGIYSVKVKHKTSQCETIVSATVIDQTISPTAFVEVLYPLTSCSMPDGMLRVNVLGSVSNYMFNWYQGSDISGPVLSTKQTLVQLSAGAYTVSVTHRTTRCKTIVSAIVPNATASNVSIAVTSNTSCTGPNGALTAIVNGAASDYTYMWFEGTTVFSGPLLSVDQTFYVYSGTYTVLVRHNFSSCESIVTGTVLDESIIPTVSIAAASNTSCTVPNGSLTATANGLLSDYAFSWYAGIDVSGPVLSVNSTIGQLSAGIYTVIVQHRDSGCVSTASALVQDERVIPVLVVQSLPNVSCIIPNGVLTASVQGSVTDYSYDWYEGPFIAEMPYYSGSPILSGIQAGVYTLSVTHNNSGCVSLITTSVSDQIISPIVTIQTSHVTTCETPNGLLTAFPQGPLSDYTYEWHAGIDITSGPVLSVNHIVNYLQAGLYTVMVMHKISGCTTIVSAQVLDECESFSTSLTNGDDNANFTDAMSGDSPISYYPNPTKGIFRIKSKAGAGHIILMDKNGKIVRSYQLSTSHTPLDIDLSDQLSGRYILTFTSGLSTSQYHIMKE